MDDGFLERRRRNIERGFKVRDWYLVTRRLPRVWIDNLISEYRIRVVIVDNIVTARQELWSIYSNRY